MEQKSAGAAAAVKEVVRATGVSFSYGAQSVLSACDFSVGEGELVALAGPNGAGKSTLLALLSGCRAPGKGSLTVFGTDASQWPPAELALRLAALPQRDLTPGTFTALEAVLLGRSPFLKGFFRFETGEDTAIAKAALERVGAAHLAHKLLSTISGGERQLVCLARALAQQPRLLLLDEPATGLDLGHQQALFRLLRSLNREEGLTIISVTHDLNLASLYFDRLLLLHAGSIKGDGAPAALIKPEILEPIYGAQVWTTTGPAGAAMVGLMP